MPPRYCIDKENIMHENIDGEVVIVNLLTGTYYAIDGAGGFLWDILAERGASLEELLIRARACFNGSEEDIKQGVESFFNALQKENLLLESTEDGALEFDNPPTAVDFDMPKLNIYNDMEALLLADPIHEVEPSGWPQVK